MQKNLQPALWLDAYTPEILENYYVKDLNIILRNRGILQEYNAQYKNKLKTAKNKIDFIVFKNIVTKSYMDAISPDIIGILIENNIQMCVALVRLSKTMRFILDSYLSYNFLEKYIGNGYKCNRELPCSIAWDLFSALSQPNFLSKITEIPGFISHKKLVLQVLGTMRIENVNDVLIKCDMGTTWFTIPGVNIDFYYAHPDVNAWSVASDDHAFWRIWRTKDDIKILNDYHNGLEPAGKAIIVLTKGMGCDSNTIIHPMFVDSVLGNNKHNNIDELVSLMNMSTFSEPDLGVSCNKIFYRNLGKFPPICETYMKQAKKLTFGFLFALDLNRDLLNFYLMDDTKNHNRTNLHLLVKYCYDNISHDFAECVCNELSYTMNVDFLLHSFYSLFLASKSVNLVTVIMKYEKHAYKHLIRITQFIDELVNCVILLRPNKFRVLMKYKKYITTPPLELCISHYPDLIRYTKKYDAMFDVLREYSQQIILRDLNRYIGNIRKLGNIPEEFVTLLESF